jgi:hypothetical protein
MKPSTTLTLGALALTAVSCGDNKDQEILDALASKTLSPEEISLVCSYRAGREMKSCHKRTPGEQCKELGEMVRAECYEIFDEDNSTDELFPKEAKRLCKARVATILANHPLERKKRLKDHCKGAVRK